MTLSFKIIEQNIIDVYHSNILILSKIFIKFLNWAIKLPNSCILDFDQPTISFIDGTSSPVIEGQPIHLFCNVANFLNWISLVYQWTKGNKVLEQNNAQLSIPAITRSDANGPYKCTVTGTLTDTTLVKDTSESVTVHCKGCYILCISTLI